MSDPQFFLFFLRYCHFCISSFEMALSLGTFSSESTYNMPCAILFLFVKNHANGILQVYT